MRNLIDNGIVEEYTPLSDIKGSYTAQFEHVSLFHFSIPHSSIFLFQETDVGACSLTHFARQSSYTAEAKKSSVVATTIETSQLHSSSKISYRLFHSFSSLLTAQRFDLRPLIHSTWWISLLLLLLPCAILLSSDFSYFLNSGLA